MRILGKHYKMADKKSITEQEGFRHIVRVANVDLPGAKAIYVALTKIKGVGKNLASAICSLAGVERSKPTGLLSEDEVTKLDTVARDPMASGVPVWMTNRRKDYETGDDKHLLSGTLDFTQENDLKRLKKIKSLRGFRHGRGLPVRGQRTKSNFRHGKGKVVGVKKKGK